VRPIDVNVGATDNLSTKITGEGISEGMELVIGEVLDAASGSDERDPFLPKVGRH